MLKIFERNYLFCWVKFIRLWSFKRWTKAGLQFINFFSHLQMWVSYLMSFLELKRAKLTSKKKIPFANVNPRNKTPKKKTSIHNNTNFHFLFIGTVTSSPTTGVLQVEHIKMEEFPFVLLFPKYLSKNIIIYRSLLFLSFLWGNSQRECCRLMVL